MTVSSLYPDQDSFLRALRDLRARFEASAPVLEVTLRDPSMDVEGYIVVHNTNISLHGPLAGAGQGCGKGGTRITPDLTLDDVKMLAHKMALKNAAAGLPLGGAKSGLRGDPDAPGFEARYKRFIELSRSFLFENGGCFGGFGFDIGARRIHAEWACSVLGTTNSFTGKPPHMGGTDYDREGIAGLGVAVAAGAAIEARFTHITKPRYVVQGAGAMGAAVIHYFGEMGGHLAGVCDPRLGGAWRFDTPPTAALWHALSHMDFEAASVQLPQEAKKLAHMDDVLGLPCDVLFPCAVQNVVHADNAAHIKAALVVEGANSPCTLDAYNIFKDKDILVIPDFMANAGGIIAAFVELTEVVDHQENAAKGIKAKLAKDKTRRCIADNINEMLSLMDHYDVRPIDAASFLALTRLYQ